MDFDSKGDFDRQYKRVSHSLGRIIHSLTSEKDHFPATTFSSFNGKYYFFYKNIILLILISYYILLNLKIIIVSNPSSSGFTI